MTRPANGSMRPANRRATAVRVVLGVLGTWCAAMVIPAVGWASVSSVLAGHTISGGGIPCTTQSDGVRICHGTDGGTSGPDLLLKSFDGSPLESYVILPPVPGTGRTDGDYPLIVQSHGYASRAGGPNDTQYFGPTADQWARQGYAVLQLSARGFGDSCGKTTLEDAPLAYATYCADGYIRLDDDRYEVRDIQDVVGLLVDEGLANPDAIGLTGESYGGGVSLQAATLNNRVMLPDGTVEAWTSPDGVPLHVAAAAPMIPWSDLDSALLPNGHELDYQKVTPTTNLDPIGVPILSFLSGLVAEGEESGNYATPGGNSQADILSWYADIAAGEPYDGRADDESIENQIARYHSALYILDNAYGTGNVAPAPMMMANGFTDDLFPASQALQYYNVERTLYPHDSISLDFGDFGHAPAQNKADAMALLSAKVTDFFAYYLKHAGSRPASNVTATTQTCPKAAASGGPYVAPTWARLHPGAVEYQSGGTQTVISATGNATIGTTIDPITGSGICATVSATDQRAGVATYRLPAATGAGYTLLGSPTIVANLTATGLYPQLDARLWDVDEQANTETLVARGVYRLNPASPDGVQVFQLHPGAWHFAAGHVAKLELLGTDTPYYRPSNGVSTISVSDLQLRLPVHERAGTAGVVAPPPPVYTDCTSAPTSTINSAHTVLAPRAVILAGTSAETQCAGVTEAVFSDEHVARVQVTVARKVSASRCQFLQPNGRLSASRPCDRADELAARGTGRWSTRLKLAHALPSGHYVLTSEATDADGHTQQTARGSVTTRSLR